MPQRTRPETFTPRCLASAQVGANGRLSSDFLEHLATEKHDDVPVELLEQEVVLGAILEAR